MYKGITMPTAHDYMYHYTTLKDRNSCIEDYLNVNYSLSSEQIEEYFKNEMEMHQMRSTFLRIDDRGLVVGVG